MFKPNLDVDKIKLLTYLYPKFLYITNQMTD